MNMLEKSHRETEGSVTFDESPKALVTRVIDVVQGSKTCYVGEKCPQYIYENYDGVGGPSMGEGKRVM